MLCAWKTKGFLHLKHLLGNSGALLSVQHPRGRCGGAFSHSTLLSAGLSAPSTAHLCALTVQGDLVGSSHSAPVSSGLRLGQEVVAWMCAGVGQEMLGEILGKAKHGARNFVMGMWVGCP